MSAISWQHFGPAQIDQLPTHQHFRGCLAPLSTSFWMYIIEILQNRFNKRRAEVADGVVTSPRFLLFIINAYG